MAVVGKIMAFSSYFFHRYCYQIHQILQLKVTKKNHSLWPRVALGLSSLSEQLAQKLLKEL